MKAAVIAMLRRPEGAEGSVRKAGGRVRITAQLIDAVSEAHLWADRFDGSLEDIFELQDKVATNVAGVIEPTLQVAEIRRSKNRPTHDHTGRFRCISRSSARGRRLYWRDLPSGLTNPWKCDIFCRTPTAAGRVRSDRRPASGTPRHNFAGSRNR